ncbi:bile acid:sodium symporter family protein [Algibacillus agarilyticus]|uniref:bile acid:sodium symporter family protein n=1 Tax=Algibacillus agarilyticus TaxID=2234133 RepID=UPI000DCFEA46|nr:bile acid:sodium symporter family protein [Algibacillus agarilyticus]
MEASLLSQVVLPFSLFIIMLGMGLSLQIADFTRVMLYPKAMTIGVICQLLMLPIVGYIIVTLFGFTTELAVGIMLLTFCPGGVTSNMYCFLAKGDTALSISLTALTSLITPFTIPILTMLMMQHFMDTSQIMSMPVTKTIMQLLVITILPVSIGMFWRYKKPTFAQQAQYKIKLFSVVFLFLIIASIIAKEWANMAHYFVQTGLATLILNSSTLVLGFMIAKASRLNQAQSISIAIEVGIQNGTLALLIASTLLNNLAMTVPAITYSLIMFATGGLFCWWCGRKCCDRKLTE